MSIPQTTKALVIQKAKGGDKQGPDVYHDVVLVEKPIKPLQSNELLIRVSAAAFNRRDYWIRRGQYPGIAFGNTLGADAVGVVIAAGTPNDPFLNKRVILSPIRGWDSYPGAATTEVPNAISLVGGVKYPPIGYFTEYVTVEKDDVILAPEHLDDVGAAAWPVGGLTAWRACIVYGGVESSQNVLITGIGGGVALLALQICVAKGANVYVTGGSQEKIDFAKSLGAKDGVIYKDKQWPSNLARILENALKPMLDCVIDSAGDEIMTKTSKLLKSGGAVVCYGLTTLKNITFTMREVLRNQRLIGSTMGSKQDLIDATAFLAEHKFVPVVSHVLDGLENAEEGFELLRKGENLGKIVVKITKTKQGNTRL